MPRDSGSPRIWRSALTAFAVVGVVALLVGGALWLAALRGPIAAAGGSLATRADALAAAVDAAPPARAAHLVGTAGLPARLSGPDGATIAQARGGTAVWNAAPSGRIVSLATLGTSGWSARDGVVVATRDLSGGRALELRAPLAPGVGVPRPSPMVFALIVVLVALLGALLAGLRASRLRARLARVSAALEASARMPAPAEGGEWARLEEASAALVARADGLREAALARADALAAAVAPLGHPVACTAPGRPMAANEALERLLSTMTGRDAAALSDALRAALGGASPAGRRLRLADGRTLEVESWSVPGGRMAAVADRSEQARLAELRRRVTGSAARHLQGPVREIQVMGSDLLAHVPASDADAARGILAAADRLDRLIGRMLRGTDHDPRARPPRLRPIGVAGIAYALGRDLDGRLRERGLRLETAIPEGLPPVRTDGALVHEILSELIANSSAVTPRGGTITLSGREVGDDLVEIAVGDGGTGIPGDEIVVARERFARGAAAAGLPGAGLGLAVAGSLAERIGGRLVLEAGPGGRARLILPVADAPTRPAPPEVSAAVTAP